jgi:hypothetical protein
LEAIASKLINYFSKEYGGQWYCTIAAEQFAAKFDSQPNSLIWFSLGSTHIILFKPGFMYPKDLIQESKHSNPKIGFVKNEMDNKMSNFAINISLNAIKAFDKFDLIAKNISQIFDEEYGKYWNCIIGQKGIDASVGYVNGSYVNAIIDDLEIVLFQTNQPQYKVYKNQSNLSYF